jgi:hypothetical protein
MGISMNSEVMKHSVQSGDVSQGQCVSSVQLFVGVDQIFFHRWRRNSSSHSEVIVIVIQRRGRARGRREREGEVCVLCEHANVITRCCRKGRRRVPPVTRVRSPPKEHEILRAKIHMLRIQLIRQAQEVIGLLVNPLDLVVRRVPLEFS